MPTTLNLGCIVEGKGEVEAIRLLVRRIQIEVAPDLQIKIAQPWRTGRYKLVKPGELERVVELTARQLQPPRALLILIDADDDCPAELGPRLLQRAKAARPDVSIGLVLAKREYEAWFLAAIESLHGQRGLECESVTIPDPEGPRDAKKALNGCMKEGRTYSPRIDQAALTARFDMELARRHSPSFDKCWREMARLLSEAAG